MNTATVQTGGARAFFDDINDGTPIDAAAAVAKAVDSGDQLLCECEETLRTLERRRAGRKSLLEILPASNEVDYELLKRLSSGADMCRMHSWEVQRLESLFYWKEVTMTEMESRQNADDELAIVRSRIDDARHLWALPLALYDASCEENSAAMKELDSVRRASVSGRDDSGLETHNAATATVEDKNGADGNGGAGSLEQEMSPTLRGDASDAAGFRIESHASVIVAPSSTPLVAVGEDGSPTVSPANPAELEQTVALPQQQQRQLVPRAKKMDSFFQAVELAESKRSERLTCDIEECGEEEGAVVTPEKPPQDGGDAQGKLIMKQDITAPSQMRSPVSPISSVDIADALAVVSDTVDPMSFDMDQRGTDVSPTRPPQHDHGLFQQQQPRMKQFASRALSPFFANAAQDEDREAAARAEDEVDIGADGGDGNDEDCSLPEWLHPPGGAIVDVGGEGERLKSDDKHEDSAERKDAVEETVVAPKQAGMGAIRTPPWKRKHLASGAGSPVTVAGAEAGGAGAVATADPVRIRDGVNNGKDSNAREAAAKLEVEAKAQTDSVILLNSESTAFGTTVATGVDEENNDRVAHDESSSPPADVAAPTVDASVDAAAISPGSDDGQEAGSPQMVVVDGTINPSRLVDSPQLVQRAMKTTGIGSVHHQGMQSRGQRMLIQASALQQDIVAAASAVVLKQKTRADKGVKGNGDVGFLCTPPPRAGSQSPSSESPSSPPLLSMDHAQGAVAVRGVKGRNDSAPDPAAAPPLDSRGGVATAAAAPSTDYDQAPFSEDAMRSNAFRRRALPMASPSTAPVPRGILKQPVSCSPPMVRLQCDKLAAVGEGGEDYEHLRAEVMKSCGLISRLVEHMGLIVKEVNEHVRSGQAIQQQQAQARQRSRRKSSSPRMVMGYNSSRQQNEISNARSSPEAPILAAASPAFCMQPFVIEGAESLMEEGKQSVERSTCLLELIANVGAKRRRGEDGVIQANDDQTDCEASPGGDCDANAQGEGKVQRAVGLRKLRRVSFASGNALCRYHVA